MAIFTFTFSRLCRQSAFVSVSRSVLERECVDVRNYARFFIPIVITRLSLVFRSFGIII